MNDHVLFEMVKRADPLAADVGELPHELLERVLATPRPVSKPRRTPRWQARFALVAVVLGLSAVIVSLAIAGTGWLIGSPAPANVKADFGSYSTQLGFNPQPGKAVLVASDGDYQLYATVNKQGGLCTLVSTPGNRPGPNGEGGDCVASPPDAAAFWAGVGGILGSPDTGTTLVLDGHTTDTGAASVQFVGPKGDPVTAPVGTGGFFIVGTTAPGSPCDWGAWTPRFAVLDSSGHQLSAASVTILPGARKFTVRGRTACAAVVHGPFGASAGQLPLGG